MNLIRIIRVEKCLSISVILFFLICVEMPAIQADSWGNSNWVPIGVINSHQPREYNWCDIGDFITGLDLDRCGDCDPHDSPVVGQAKCSDLDPIYEGWWFCNWVKVGAAKSHQKQFFCPNGYFITALDWDGDRSLSGNDAPIIGQARCCQMDGPNGVYNSWAKTYWKDIERAGINSHQPNDYCDDGDFLIGLDLDGANIDDLDAPVIGAAACATPG